MGLEQCPTCGEWGFLDKGPLRHRCKPEWQARMEWQADDEWWTVRANDAEQAAEVCAEQYDSESGEYQILARGGGDVVALVRKAASAAIERFAIEAEAVPTYSATATSD